MSALEKGFGLRITRLDGSQRWLGSDDTDTLKAEWVCPLREMAARATSLMRLLSTNRGVEIVPVRKVIKSVPPKRTFEEVSEEARDGYVSIKSTRQPGMPGYIFQCWIKETTGPATSIEVWEEDK